MAAPTLLLFNIYAKNVYKNYHIHDSLILISTENGYMIAVSLKYRRYASSLYLEFCESGLFCAIHVVKPRGGGTQL